MLKLTKKHRDRLKDKPLPLVDQEMEEHLSVLNAEDRAAVDRVTKEVDTKIVEASRESVKGKKLLVEGRCPECGHKVQKFLFTSICENCGWSQYHRPEQGRAVVHLKGGTPAETIDCDQTFSTPEEVLCVAGDVVRFRVPRAQVLFIEYRWTDEEIQQRRKDIESEEVEECDWCNHIFLRGDEDAQVTFAAFGKDQNRYMFCSEECQRSFQKLYPTRIHRDCYNRICENCNECHKRFDDTSYETYTDEDLVH